MPPPPDPPPPDAPAPPPYPAENSAAPAEPASALVAPTTAPVPESAPAGSATIPLGSLSVDQVDALLRGLNLERVAAKFAGEGVTGEDLAALCDDDLAAMGVSVPTQRRKLVSKIGEFTAAGVPASLIPGPASAPAAAEAEDKFYARQLIMGVATEAALGLTAALGLSEVERAALEQKGEAAIVDEFERHGSAEDQANLQYVLRGTALKDDDLPAHVRQQIRTGRYHGGTLGPDDFDHGHGGMALADFVGHEHARLAQLLRPHVLALRLYTSTSYPCFNRHMRNRAKPNPFAMSVFFLDQGLKKLRAVAAQLEPGEFTQVVWLWRGMKDLTLDREEFMRYGGTELAPMSTSRSQSVAFKYAASQCPLVFKYKTRSLGRGCSIRFLSVYPKEEEYLYPPCTFLQPESVYTEQGYTVVEVMPMMS